MSNGRLPASWKISYAAILVPVTVLQAPALSMLPALYAKHSPIGLGVIGTILIVTRLLDAVTDPLIGYVSDKTHSRLGTRKPWIIGGAALCCVGCYFWFRPGESTGWMYFTFWSTIVYIGWTIIEIPHGAWLSELTRDYTERSNLSTYRAIAGYVGWALFLSLPLWPIFPSTEMTPQVTAFASWFVILFLPIVVLIAVVVLPSDSIEHEKRTDPFETSRALISNIPFRYYAGSLLSSFLASGMVAALYFIFLDQYLNILDRIAHIGLLAAIVSIVGALIWSPIINVLGKHRVMALGSGANVFVLLGMFLLSPGEDAFLGMALLFSLSAILVAGNEIASYALLADVVDYDNLRTGRKHAGNFFAMQALIRKSGMAIGGGSGFLIIAWFGFDANGNNNTAAMSGFFLAFIFVPMALNGLSAILAWKFPLDRRRHAIVVRRLASRSDDKP